ncbi:type-X family DNA polymerase [Aspergillus candidus]|uniref:DNA polymerase IV n=1 Tax=Aspergillus candidus TaxID=41067 RepID=A0A2I2FFT5_ASPCN|nr:DNA polymerase IV [Aspergillus candidus]PLB39498.1 DNA polymerase IV [Aspergillus candidus]
MSTETHPDDLDSADFSSCPPIFVLPTHLSLDELHEVEEHLTQRGAQLTYNVAEAQLFLGNISQKKRAALELRSRGLWTEEPAGLARDYPAVKRRRVEEGGRARVEDRAPDEVIDLSTETEDEADGVGSRHDSGRHLKRPAPLSNSSPESGADGLRVVKLEWLNRCVEERRLVPVDSFVVYQAVKVKRPGAKPADPVNAVKGILQRAKEDASKAGTIVSTPPGRRPMDTSPSSQRPPPKLYRQTTSENEEAVPLPPAPSWVKERVMYACLRSAPLHPPNERFISQLLKIRTIRELTLDEIGVRAYSTSIAAIAAYPYSFRRGSEILALPGCEAKIAHLFAEFQQSEHGTLSAADALTTDPALRDLHTFNQIWGVGPKTARDFYYKRGWRDLDDIVEHGWDSLSRVQQIGVKFFDELLTGIPRTESEEIAHTVRQHANRVRPSAEGSPENDARGVECIVVGGYRRGKESSGDVDIILSHPDESTTQDLVVDVVASLEAEGWITHTLALHTMASSRDQQPRPVPHGDGLTSSSHFDHLDKALVVWQDPHFDDDHHNDDDKNPDKEECQRQRRKRNPNIHRRVDIIISPWRTVGCAVLGWTGDTTFERDLRRYAKKAHGWRFDSSGVRQYPTTTGQGAIVDLEGSGETWEERERLVMEGLGVGWRLAGERCSR